MNYKGPKANAKLEYIVPMLKFFIEKPEGFTSQEELYEYIQGADPQYLVRKFKDGSTKPYDLSSIWNRHELWRYVGLIKRRDFGKGYKLSSQGIAFYAAYNSGDNDKAREIFIASALENNYGKKNAAVKNNSPISMVHALFTLLFKGDLTKQNLIMFMHYLLVTQDINEALKFKNASFNILDGYKNKMNDNKFFILLENLEIITEVKGVYKYYNQKAISSDSISLEGMRFNPKYSILINYSDDQRRIRRASGLTFDAVKKSGFVCEANNYHKTFEWNKKGGQYMEGHHLLAVEFDDLVMHQKKYKVDVLKNIHSLCPNCHSTFRSGTNDAKKSLIDKLWNNRKDYYLSNNIQLEYVYDLYMINY